MDNIPSYSNQRIQRMLFYSLLFSMIIISILIVLTESTLLMNRNNSLLIFVITLYTIIILFSSWVLSRILATKITAYYTSTIARISKEIDGIMAGATESISSVNSNESAEFIDLISTTNQLAKQSLNAFADMSRLQRVRSEFLGNVSHELRTPVFAIQGYLETLLDGALEDPNVAMSFVQKAYSNTERLNILLGDLIDISRIESGEMRMSFRYFNICDVLREAVQNLDLKASQNSINLELLPSRDEVSVFGDKERILQVVGNLLSNAIKYNSPGGHVKAEIQDMRGEAIIIISDSGFGIAPEHQERIFERFYRVDTSRARSIAGSGLGLSIVKHILEAHGSHIKMQSAVGVGTTISFSLKK
jgi:two-component system, OmpR family, phosphate regulon sensor histidine kinase PhoR